MAAHTTSLASSRTFKVYPSSVDRPNIAVFMAPVKRQQHAKKPNERVEVASVVAGAVTFARATL
jgi:hypothetical protein